MLKVMIEGSSFDSSPISLSAGGQDEQPCEVNNSTTARGSVALAGRMTATTAQRPRAPDHRDMELLLIVQVILQSSYWSVDTTRKTVESYNPAVNRFTLLRRIAPASPPQEGGPFIGRLPFPCHSLRSEASITFRVTRQASAARTAGCRRCDN